MGLPPNWMELGAHNRVYSAGEVPYADGGVSYQGETVLILCTSSHDNKFNPVQARECVEWQVPVSSPAPSVACMRIPRIPRIIVAVYH